MAVVPGEVPLENVERKLKKQQDEERRLAEMMIPKKKRQLYNKIVHSRKKKAHNVSLVVIQSVERSCWPFWPILSHQRKYMPNVHKQKERKKEITSNIVVSIVPADGLAVMCQDTFTGTVIWVWQIYSAVSL